ncbi:hypothetical protein V6N13_044234 [Hibiscus sabdariffa]|uniref:Uncharacterized protein n=1 Tax=Hibiscus sabdariffa TaxID=183260 RepID=A0ABR2RHY6_9ROSI
MPKSFLCLQMGWLPLAVTFNLERNPSSSLFSSIISPFNSWNWFLNLSSGLVEFRFQVKELSWNNKQLEFGSMKTNGKAIAIHTLLFFAIYAVLIMAVHLHIYTG